MTGRKQWRNPAAPYAIWGPDGKSLPTPKALMTDIWRNVGIYPFLWEELQIAQERCDEAMGPEGDAYPIDASDRDLIFLSYHLPSPLGVAMLRRRLVRGVALRQQALRL